MKKLKLNYNKLSLITEYIAIFILWLKGYEILQHRYKNHFGEIDIIAKKKNILVAIEVKFRSNKDILFDSITEHQKQRISNALDFFIKRSIRLKNFNIRYDAMYISNKILPMHIKNAW